MTRDMCFAGDDDDDDDDTFIKVSNCNSGI